MLRRFAPIVLLLALCAPASPGVYAQDGTTWRVESITPLSELVPRASQWVLPAPDAARVAWVDGGDPQEACMFDLAAESETCVPLPEEAGRGFVPGSLPPLVWSPDSQRLAVVGSPLQLFVDNDLTVANFAAQTATVLAPDETTGSLPIGKPGEEAIIDVHPAWSPDSTRIAVERTQWSDESDRIGRIAIVDAATGEETTSLRFPMVSPDGYNFGVTMALAWSPDGASLAWGRYAPGTPAQENGVWLIGSGTAEQIISLADIQPFMSAPEAEANVVRAFVWAPDGSAALVWVYNPYVGEQRILLYDAANGTLSALPRPDEIADTHLYAEAAWSPDGSAVVVTSAVAESDPERMLVEDPRTGSATALWVADLDTGTATLLGYLPPMVFRPTLGVWDADGGAILSGYHFTLAQE